jgi:hypothetical protein
MPTPASSIRSPQLTHLACNAAGFHGYQWRTTCPARSPRPARTTCGDTATLNRAMTIPVTSAARLAKPEAPRAAARRRRPRGCRGSHRTRRGPVMARRRVRAARRGRRPMRLSRGPGPTGCRPGGGGSPSSTALRCPRRSAVMAVRTAAACPDLPGELPDSGADSATLRGAEPRAGRARPRRVLDARGVLHRLHDIVAGIWHVEGVVPVRDRLTYPQVGCRAHRPGRFSPERAVVRAPVSPGCGPWENLVYPDGRLRSRRTRYSFVWLALRLSSGSRPPIFARIWSRVSQE